MHTRHFSNVVCLKKEGIHFIYVCKSVGGPESGSASADLINISDFAFLAEVPLRRVSFSSCVCRPGGGRSGGSHHASLLPLWRHRQHSISNGVHRPAWVPSAVLKIRFLLLISTKWADRCSLCARCPQLKDPLNLLRPSSDSEANLMFNWKCCQWPSFPQLSATAWIKNQLQH